MTTIVSATDLQSPSKPTRKRKDNRVRHTWGIHVPDAEDKMFSQFQAYAFQIGVLKENTKYALVRYALDRLLDTITKLQEREDFQAVVARASPAPVSPSVPRPDPVVTALQAQKQIIENRLRAMGVSQ